MVKGNIDLFVKIKVCVYIGFVSDPILLDLFVESNFHLDHLNHNPDQNLQLINYIVSKDDLQKEDVLFNKFGV
jgi:hypothetical protein